MCGLYGILAAGDAILPDSGKVHAARLDLLRHRGPDDRGVWQDRNAWIGHRRLAIMDPGRGQEPFVIDEGTDDPCIVVFNGELLEHETLREPLRREGAVFRTDCDAETAAVALARWGDEALRRFRGMFAAVWYRPATRTLSLARDPFGVVPLLHLVDPEGHVVFASEMGPMLAHLGPAARIDPATVGAYLSTIRLTLGDRTLVSGVRTVRPGHLVSIDLSGPRPRMRERSWWSVPKATGDLRGSDADEALRTVLVDSLEAHLQSDVEVCSLLSGGIDSAILTRLAADRRPDWRTFTAVGGDGREDVDRAAAARLVRLFGVGSTEVAVSDADESPIDRWTRMVDSLGVPLGTPNEIAINALAEAVRDAGIKVAISGEGADELLGGYEPVLRVVASIAAAAPSAAVAAATLLETIAWIAPSRQRTLLADGWIEAIGNSDTLVAETTAAIESGGSPGDPRSYLHWLQRVNLAGLLGRLNHACMLASVEARPPFADRRVAEVVARIATEDLFRIPTDDAAPAATKLALRRAFGPVLPHDIVQRPKASFPTPFEDWSVRMLRDLTVRESLEPLIGGVLAQAFSGLGSREPNGSISPMFAWPLANLGIWSSRTGVPLQA
ncbi:MAG: asparagine synthase (glutamine-hydrolyzing) [Planctomycetota bacterium]|nr:asparagine synthase (glutamine-hydrolyzing) [Planctomycetota bacterium]